MRPRFADSRNGTSSSDDYIHLHTYQPVSDLGKALVALLRTAIDDSDGATLDPTEFAQSLHESSRPIAPIRRRACPQKTDGRHLRRLLPVRPVRPRSRAAEQRDE